MKKFLLKLLLFVICFWAFDKLFIPIVNNAPSLEVDKKLEDVLQGKFNHDILIFGSSISSFGIYAKQLGDSLKCKAYNLSSPGSDIEYQEFVLRQLILNKNKKPKLLVLSVDEPGELYFDKVVNFRLDRLYPLVKYQQIKDELIARGEKNKYLSSLFILHQLGKSNLDFRTRQFAANDRIMPCGSMINSLRTNNFPGGYYNGNRQYDITKELPPKRKKFKSFIETCAREHIKLMIVFMPRFHSRNFYFEQRIKNLAGPNIIYYGYSENSITYKQKEYFNDAVHLNFEGAKLYTNDLFNYIKSERLLY